MFLLENWDPLSSNAPKDKNGNNLYYLNVGTGKEISIKELAYKIANLVDFKGEILWDSSKPNGTYQKKLDINLMRKLGWQQKISLKEGIKKTVKEFRENYFL